MRTPSQGQLAAISGSFGSPRLHVPGLPVANVLEVVLIVCAAPLLLAPTFSRGRFVPVAYALLVAAQIKPLYGVLRSGPRRTLFPPAVVLVLMAFCSLSVTVDASLSWQKIDGIVLGLALYLCVARLSDRLPGLIIAALGLALVAMGISLIGLVSTAWASPKLPFLGAVFDSIPRLITSVPTAEGVESGVNPNELGGVLVLTWPVLVALVTLAAGPTYRGGLARRIAIAGLAVALVLVSGVLVLTASLSAFLGAAVGLLVLGASMRRRIAVVLALGCVAAIPVVVAVLLTSHSGTLQNLLAAYQAHLALRVELWQRALFVMQDFPLTGVGINTLPVTVGQLYPLVLASSDPRPPPHVHNFFLQTGVDLGVPGLVALLWLLGLTGRVLWWAWSHGSSLERRLAAGLAAGLCAHLVFGLTDAVALGARADFVLWWMLGLCEGVYWSARAADGRTTERM